MDELVLWRQALKRYTAIGAALVGVIQAIGSEGNESIGVPCCGFCMENKKEGKEDCANCPWGKEFGVCNAEGSRWDTMRDLNSVMISQCRLTIGQIQDKIKELGANQGDPHK